MKLPILSIKDVAEGQLCCGCGACAAASPERISMVDDARFGRRPWIANGPLDDEPMRRAMEACPGTRLDAPAAPKGAIAELLPAWGPVLELWEGHASDPEIRFAASSGGAASALALYCLERAGMHGLLHVDARTDVPYLNRTVMSTRREQVLRACGSRYAPASPCEGLPLVESAPASCVMIGKPCDIAGARRLAAARPALERNLGLTIAVFCAGTPSTQGTLEMLKAMGVSDPASVESVRYRGNGWPGRATVRSRTTSGIEERSLSYDESWGDILQKHRQWRCYICPDHTGEAADIAVGDPWYRPIPEGDPGHSLVLARTERGRQIIEDAATAGYLTLRRVEPRILPASQPNLLRTRGAVWGRLLALRLAGAPTPIYQGMEMLRFWLSELSFRDKLQSITGTLRRISRKKLKERHPVVPLEPARSHAQGVSCAGGGAHG